MDLEALRPSGVMARIRPAAPQRAGSRSRPPAYSQIEDRSDLFTARAGDRSRINSPHCCSPDANLAPKYFIERQDADL